MVSRASDALGDKASDTATTPDISDDGRFVAFASRATNLTPEGTTGVFLRDLQAQTTTLVSRASGFAGQPAPSSYTPSVSADGRVVAFTSTDQNLDPADSELSSEDVYVRDLEAETTTLASRASGIDGEVSQQRSNFPSISADGSRVEFKSFSRFGTINDDTPFSAALVRDFPTHRTWLASRRTGPKGEELGGDVVNSSISGNGRLVAFGLGTVIWVRNLAKRTTRRVSLPVRSVAGPDDDFTNPSYEGRLPSFSFDGRLITYQESRPEKEGQPRPLRVMLINRRSKEVEPVPGAYGPTGLGLSLLPSISTDGDWVTFQSTATTLTPDDSDAQQDIFLTRLPDR